MELKSDQYYIDNLNVLDLCNEYQTPLYVYDSSKIVSQYKKLTTAFSDVDLKIKYALKANSNINIIKLLKEQGAGLDAVSIQEVRYGLQIGFKPDDILFTPNSVSFEEIKEAVELNVKINIDNISVLEQFGHLYENSIPVCVRINPHIVAGGHSHIQTGHIDSKFGISIHQLRHIIRIVKANNMLIEGLHMHTGSDILDSQVFLNAAEVLFNAALEFKDLQFLDFGSGFKVSYKEGDISTDVEDLGKKVSKRFKEFCEEYGRNLELWFEPGKYLVSESGYLLVKTNIVKQTVATVFTGVDSGLNHLIRPMFYDGYHHIVNISNPTGTQRIYTVVGYICETDTFGSDRKLNEVREGDILAILNAGAYGYSMSSNYNMRCRPAEVLIHEGKAHLIRKRETAEDMQRNLVEIDL
ncbi:MAG: diaminopimelate decarboxylase [Bacteroidetes bacterium]|nr:MAG: diaminopimelate decarboxylase [Bacteroidota bacterium]